MNFHFQNISVHQSFNVRLNLHIIFCLQSSGIRVIPKGDAMSVIDSIVETYQREQRRKRRQQRRQERRRRRLHNKINGLPPRECTTHHLANRIHNSLLYN